MIEVPMTDAQFAAASQRLGANGIVLSSPSGTISREGITADYTYSGGVLRINITKHPMFMPVSMIESRLKAYIDESLA